MEIKIKNCNNIDEGVICINENCLNIKYALNGIGKSTVANALASFVKKEDLSYLRPFKYYNDGIADHDPTLTINGTINNVAIFNEDYVDKYVFNKVEILENSFEIFVKSEKYDEHMKEINSLIEGIQKNFKDDPDLELLISNLNEFIDSFGKAQSGYSKAGDLGKSIGKGNKLENIPEDFIIFSPYLKNHQNIKWLKWHKEGESYLSITDACPYCVSKITTPLNTIVQVSKEYDSKYLSTLINVLEVFDSLSSYFTEETKFSIIKISKNTAGIKNDQIEFLKRLKDEVSTLRNRLMDLKYLGFNSLKDVDSVIKFLKSKIIDLNYYPQLDCYNTKEKIKKLNTSLQNIINKAGELQGQVAQQKHLIKKAIEKNSTQINEFLKIAGYNYKVSIELLNDDYRLTLKYLNGTDSILDVKKHLSFGERNAFALVLFMYQSIKDKADFIILDDPISSFDINKKYAIISKLFISDSSFRGKTVLMLTHDFEPVIDCIYNFSRLFNSYNAKAHFIGNISNNLDEKEITKNDIKSCIKVCWSNINESNNILHKLIYYRRLLEILDNKEKVWQLVSNIFHKNRDIPIINDREMTSEEIEEITKIIQEDIPDFNYSKVYADTKDINKMIEIYRESKSGYEKVQIYRILSDGNMESGNIIKNYLDKSFHVQNDYLFQLNPREYKIVPQYILDLCDNAIDLLEQGLSNHRF